MPGRTFGQSRCSPGPYSASSDSCRSPPPAQACHNRRRLPIQKPSAARSVPALSARQLGTSRAPPGRFLACCTHLSLHCSCWIRLHPRRQQWGFAVGAPGLIVRCMRNLNRNTQLRFDCSGRTLGLQVAGRVWQHGAFRAARALRRSPTATSRSHLDAQCLRHEMPPRPASYALSTWGSACLLGCAAPVW